MSRQPHGDATVGNRRQSPAPYHRKHRGSTFLPVPHAPHGYGAPRRRRWEAQGGGLLGRRRLRMARAWQAAKRATSAARNFAYYITIRMLRAISQFHINFAIISHVRSNSTFSQSLHFRNNHTCNMICTEGSNINSRRVQT